MLASDLLFYQAKSTEQWDYQITFSKSSTYACQKRNLIGTGDTQYEQWIYWDETWYGYGEDITVTTSSSSNTTATTKTINFGSIVKLNPDAVALTRFCTKVIANVVNQDPGGDGKDPPTAGSTSHVIIPQMAADLGVTTDNPKGGAGKSAKALLQFNNGVELVYTLSYTSMGVETHAIEPNVDYPKNWNGQTLKCKITYPY